jgi:hypothetical protein
MDERAAQAIVDAVLREPEGRKGFNWWWDEVDLTTREEIRRELRDVAQDAAS